MITVNINNYRQFMADPERQIVLTWLWELDMKFQSTVALHIQHMVPHVPEIEICPSVSYSHSLLLRPLVSQRLKFM